MKIKIIIPSHKRADNVTTLKTVTGCAICVPRSQAKEYRKYNPKAEIIEHPDKLIGKAAKMNWLIQQDENMFFIDDDITRQGRNLSKGGLFDLIVVIVDKLENHYLVQCFELKR
jgi:hypothetical protein